MVVDGDGGGSGDDGGEENDGSETVRLLLLFFVDVDCAVTGATTLTVIQSLVSGQSYAIPMMMMMMKGDY